jgi:hypothetical protein
MPTMPLALVHSRALDGLNAPPVTVEVHPANGLPSFTLVGLADTEVQETLERVRAALQNSALELRSASWRPVARSTPNAWDRPSTPASCRWPVICDP